jgi:hypothetical protein
MGQAGAWLPGGRSNDYQFCLALTMIILPYKLGHLLGWLCGLALLCPSLEQLGVGGRRKWSHNLCRLCAECSKGIRTGNWALESPRKGTEDSGGGHGGVAMRMPC